GSRARHRCWRQRLPGQEQSRSEQSAGGRVAARVGTDLQKMHADQKKVLGVDDSQVTRMLLVQLLSSDPALQVIGVVNDGQAALDFLDAAGNRPDVVLMDIHMPRLDGFEAPRR